LESALFLACASAEKRDSGRSGGKTARKTASPRWIATSRRGGKTKVDRDVPARWENRAQRLEKRPLFGVRGRRTMR
jgi:hypothetical protein